MHLPSFRTIYASSRSNCTSRQFTRQFSFPGKMNRGRNSRRNGNSTLHHEPADGFPLDVSTVAKGGYSHLRRQTSQQTTMDSVPKQPKFLPALDPACEENWPSLSAGISFGSKVGVGNSDSVEGLPVLEPFDICFPKSRRSVVLKASFHAKNRGKEIEMEHSMQGTGKVLRPGMVLLKTCFTLNEQVAIVMKCRELGLGPGGFYQPCYRDGAKLRLQMMCLGLNWDPETRKYKDRRPLDDSEPPDIPHEFSLLVERAIQDSHALIKKDFSKSCVEDILPGMSPNICIVNFYTTSGRLGPPSGPG
ncbi:hypothetical protein F0562_017871 [Nyssa sinensis]|uniref:Alpha-ketoglutarate-dependent dioxygenase AlkB-like domain-containing protein n=1 Tax=Nyssa sinensis TaxID=561372 RepID=A0A5J4ZHE8_9ASTE|nr:hypothetical protein F0562_017871 [Nyssa sinensis]